MFSSIKRIKHFRVKPFELRKNKFFIIIDYCRLNIILGLWEKIKKLEKCSITNYSKFQFYFC